MIEKIMKIIVNKYYYEGEKRVFINNLKKHKQKIILMDTSIHNNIGDACIGLAETSFLENTNFQLVEITQEECELFLEIIPHYVNKKDIIVIHGGGNLGNVWLHHEQMRRKIVKMFPNNLIISMPQTFHFTDDEAGEKERKISASIYNSHNNMHFFARERVSYDLMKKYFTVDVKLTPDIVLYLNKNHFNLENISRKNILFCLRNDAEKSMDIDLRQKLEHYFIQRYENIEYTDMISNGQIGKEIREEIVKDKMIEFKKAKLVITDRLHGMIFAYLTNTPCLVFKNNNHKIYGVYEWIKECDYIKFIHDSDFTEEFLNKEILDVITSEKKDIDLNKEFVSLNKMF